MSGSKKNTRSSKLKGLKKPVLSEKPSILIHFSKFTALFTPQIFKNMFFFDLSKKIKWGIQIAFFIFFVCFFGIRYGDFLYLAQNTFLFTWRTEQFFQIMEVPGGFLEYLTCFFVQFFYFPLLGGVILAFLLLLLQKEVEVFCRFRGLYWIFSFLPSCLCAGILISFKYMIFEVALVQHIFSIPTGLCFSFGYAIYYRKERQNCAHPWTSLFLLFLMFPLFGFYSLLGIFLSCIHEWNIRKYEKKSGEGSSEEKKKTPYTLNIELLFLSFLLFPLIWYWWYQEIVSFSDLYVSSTFFSQYIYRSFFYSLFHVFCFLPVLLGSVFLFPLFLGTVKRPCRSSESDPRPVLRSYLWGVIFFVLSLMGGTICFTPHSEDFFSIIAMSRPLDQEDWDKIIEIEARCPESKTFRPVIMLRFLALFEKGELGEKLFQRTQFGVQNNEVVNVSTVRIYGSTFLYRFGFFDHSAKISMNNMVTIPYSTISIKNYLRSMVAIGDTEIAEKYLPLLESSLFHSGWARRYRDYLRFIEYQKTLSSKEKEQLINEGSALIAHDQLSPDIYANGMAVHNEIQTLRKRCCSTDVLTNLQYPELILYQAFKMCPVQANESLEKLELRLSIFLIMRSSKDFMKDIGLYIEKMGTKPLPRHFREAIVVSCHSKTDSYNRSDYPVGLDDDKALMEYLRLSITARNESNNRKALAEKEAVNDTYWHYLFDVPEMPFY